MPERWVRFTSHLSEDERFVHRRIRIMRVAGCHLGEWLYLPICRDSGRGHHRRPLKNRESTHSSSRETEKNRRVGEERTRERTRERERERERATRKKSKGRKHPRRGS